MNIIIPLGGKGERFSKEGYAMPKPLIEILDKRMIDYVIENLVLTSDDCLYIVYNYGLDNHGFSNIIKAKYPFIQLIKINDTKGAVETLFLGIEHIIKTGNINKKSLILDCDTFYTEDIVSIFKSSDTNMVFYTKNYDKNPIYSYIELTDKCSQITNIKEKQKISDNANTGAYAFTDISELRIYCKYVLDNNITFNNEPYTSCVISEMIKDSISFNGYELCENNVFSLGTPSAVEKYIDNTYAFLFDLDGTIVITDDIYYDAWHKILSKYNIELTPEMFSKFIQGNNDTYILKTLLKNIEINIKELSDLKDRLFIENIDKIKVVDGVYRLIKDIKTLGNKICIVTNCNRPVANFIVETIGIETAIDFLITSNDCLNGKPSTEPYERAMQKYKLGNKKCIIFEDSKTGLLSGKGINPYTLIGIETTYAADDLLNYGADSSIKDFTDINIIDLLQVDNTAMFNLKTVIKKNTIINNIKCIEVDESKLKGGFIANVIGFKITTNDNLVHSQILKYENTQENGLSNMAKQLDLYEREYYFYTNISNHVNLCIPRFYNLLVDDNNHKIGIALENLLDKNYKINLDLNKESIDVTLAIIDRMARLHGKFWNKNLKTIFPDLKTSTDKSFCPFFKEFIDNRYEAFETKWFNIFNNKQKAICKEIYKNFSDIQHRFSIGNNITFIHGDIKSPNIFYDTERGKEPYFIDWQHCAIGKGVQDLIFFIIESFEINNLNQIFYLTKYYYYKKLIDYGVVNYSFEEYERDIYDAICYIPFFTSIWFGTTPQDELIDKNFPYFFISKMLYLLELAQ
jgi:HAD superfamily hydrolase (TIGR01509 family)